MKQYSKKSLLILSCLTISLLTLSFTICAQPLTRDEIIDLCQRPSLISNPDRVLNDFIKRNKIAFLPTKRAVAYLNTNGVPKKITDQLKYNFASSIIYRVCQFEPVNGQGGAFTSLLNTVLNTERWDHLSKVSGGLLVDKTFEPIPAGPTGPTQQELDRNPNAGYVLIMGTIEDDPVAKDKEVIVQLVFRSKVQERMSIAPTKIFRMNNTKASQQETARQIARWSLDEVVKQIE